MEKALKKGLRIFESPDMLFRNAARDIISLINEFIQNKGTCTIALSGGNTPEALYRKIGSDYKDKADWHRVYFFWSDERCVPPDDINSNYKMANDNMLTKLDIPAKNIFRIKGEIEPQKSSLLYEENLKEFFAGEKIPSINIMLLGLGGDGHTASLFAGTKVLGVKDKWVTENHIPERNFWRVTMTLPVINNSKNIIFLVTGPEKSVITAKVFNEPEALLPSQLVKPVSGELIWYIDKAASSEIK